MQIESSIIQALKSINMPLEITPILSDRDGAEPKSPYLLINVISVTKVGLPRRTTSHSELDRTETLFQVKDFYVGLTLHAKSTDPAHDWFQRLDTGITSDLVDYAFSQQGLGIVNTDAMMYQPQPISGKNYKRAILGITFRTEIMDSFKVNTIHNIIYEGSYDATTPYVRVEIDFPESMYLAGTPLRKLVNEDLPNSITHLI